MPPDPEELFPGAETTAPFCTEAVDVLVIDDDADVRSVLVKVLRKAGYCVWTSKDGKDGLSHLAGRAFRLVITDIFMPDMDGFEVIMRINAATPRPHVLAISGGTLSRAGEALKTAKLLGCRGILAKPFDLPQICAIVREIIGPPLGAQRAG